MLRAACVVDYYDAAVVEVECDGGALVLSYCFPKASAVSSFMNAVDDEECSVAGVLHGVVDEWQHVVVGCRCYEIGLWQCGTAGLMMHDKCRLASRSQVVLIGGGRHVDEQYVLGLQVVGNAEVEFAHLACLAVDVGYLRFKRIVGVVGPVLVDHVAYEVVVGGRVHAESSCSAPTPHPHQSAADTVGHVGDFHRINVLLCGSVP